MAHTLEEFALRSAAGCGRSSAARAQRDCPAAPPEVVSSVPVVRRARRAPPPPRPWPSSVPLGQYGASSRPGSLRRSSAHVAAMSGAVAVAASSRLPQRVRHATACQPLKAQQKFTNTNEATCLSLGWWLWWLWCGRATCDMTKNSSSSRAGKMGTHVQADGVRKMPQNAAKNPTLPFIRELAVRIRIQIHRENMGNSSKIDRRLTHVRVYTLRAGRESTSGACPSSQ